MIQNIHRISKKQKNKISLSTKLISILFLIINIFLIKNFNKNLAEAFPGFNSHIIFDFTGTLGIGFFTLILVLISIVILYSKREKYKSELTILIISIAILIINTKKGLILTLPLISYIAGIGATKIIDRKWIIENLKYFTAITLIYGIIFSSISSIVIIANSNPSNEMIDILNELAERKDGLVLTDTELSPYVKYIGKKDTFDNNIVSNKMYKNYRREDLILLEEENIRYIIITSEMKETIWNNREEGLLTLLKDEDAFRLRESTENIYLYEFKGID